MFYKIYFKIDRAYNKFRRKKRPGFIISLAAAIGGAIASALVGVGVGIGTAMVIGVIASYASIGLTIYGGIALSSAGKKSSGIASSPSYSSPILQTQTNNQLPVPLIYGEVKLAGNRIWQNENKEKTVKRIVAFGYGEIEGYSDIKLNDILHTKINDCTVGKYYGTATQQISTLAPGDTNAERAANIGSLKHIAYLAISVPKGAKIDGSYNLTAIVKGRKVRVYSTSTSYEVIYSNNPVWCLLDALICYNGAGIALLNTGSTSNEELYKLIDIASFIEAAEYCNEVITYYELTTALTGSNNDLIFKARAANTSDVSIEYINAGANKPLSLTVSGKDVSIQLATNASSVITTTANDIISLINNDEAASALIKVSCADSNNGTGIVTALAKTFLTGGTGQPRFTFNMVIDSIFAVREAIEEFKKNCRGVLVNKGDKLQFKIDSPGDVVQVLTEEDIIIGSEVYTPITMEEHYDIIKLEYINPTYEWSKVQAQSELFEYKNEPAIVHIVDIYSITSHQQASLQAWYYLNRKILCPFSYKFSTDYRVSKREIGDIIIVPSLLMGQTYTGKIVSIADDNSGVYDVSIIPYNPALYNDELASAEPEAIVSTLNDPYVTPDDLIDFSAVINSGFIDFAWDSDDYNFVEIREGTSWESSTLIATSLSGSSYSFPIPVKENLNFFAKKVTKTYIYSENFKTANIILPVPEAVTEISLSEVGWRNSDGVHITNTDISFTAPLSEVSNYVIYLSEDDGLTWAERTSINGASNFCRILGLQTGKTYKAGIVSVNKYGLKSSMAVSSSITIVGKDAAPPNVTSLTATTIPTDRTKVKLAWSRVDSIPDLRGYEIREGNEWDTGAPITTLLYNTEEYIYTINQNKTYKFHIKAVDNSYNYSETALVTTHDGSINPNKISNFTAYQNGESVLLAWDKITETDVVGVEIRAGRSWDTGDLIVTGLKDNTFTIPISFEKTYYYTIKAITVAGNYSSLSSSASVNVANLLPKNIIQTYDELTLQSGVKTNTEFGISEYNWNTVVGTWNDYPTTSWDSFGALNVLRLVPTSSGIDVTTQANAISGGDYTGNAASQAFDDTTAYWGSSQGGAAVNGAAFIGQKNLVNPIRFLTYTNYSSTVYNITSVKSQYSNDDGATWNDIATHAVVNTVSAVNSLYFPWYPGKNGHRLRLLANSALTGSYRWIVREMQMYEGVYTQSGNYTTTEKDMGQDISAQISIDYFANTSLDLSDFKAELQYRIRLSSGTFKDSEDGWETYIRPINKTFRYFQARCVLSTNDTSKTPQVSIFEAKIDVPDVIKSGTKFIPVGGANFDYGHTYYVKPNVLITALDGKIPVYNDLNIGLSGCSSIKLVNTAGVETSGDIMWTSKGY